MNLQSDRLSSAVEKPEDPNDIDDVYDTLLVLVRYALGNNVGLLPQSCTPHKVDETVEHVDPDNFMFDTHEQAKLLSTAIAAVRSFCSP